MRTISNDFREALRGIRQLNALITYQSEKTAKYITTELSQYLISELEEYITTEMGDIKYEGEQIISLNPLCKVELFKTMCKSVTVQTRNEIPINTWLNVKIGVLVNNSYEFLDFGDYYVTESKYEADTNSYNITAYDKMVESMIPYDLNVTYPVTIKNLLISIFTRLGWEYELSSFVNQDKILTKDLFSNQDLTFRDVLDNISQVIVGNIGFDGKVAKIKYISHLESSTQIPFEIPQTLNVGNINEDRYITEEDLKDRNVTLDKKYGPLNAILITSNDIVLNNLVDSDSIEINGKTEYNFKDNLILMNDSDTFITDMFNGVKGLEYYLYDFDTIGKLCYEPLDEIVVKIGENEYKTLILNDDIKLNQGLEETYYFDTPEDTTPEYIAVDKKEKKINNALISIDKANAEIVLKVDSQGKIAKVRLDADADAGTTFDVDADNINFTGKTFNLTADNMAINSTNFSLDKNGNMIANSGTFGGTLSTSQDCTVGNNLYVGQISGSGSVDFKYIYFNNNAYIRKAESSILNIVEIYGKEKSMLKTGYYNGYTSSVSAVQDSAGINVRDTNDNVTEYITVSPGLIQMSRNPVINSDKNLKAKIKNLDVSWIDNLKVKEYEYKSAEGNKQIGLIAQDYIDEKYADYFINQGVDGNYGICYGNITNALIQYCQELKSKVNDLEQRIETLEVKK